METRTILVLLGLLAAGAVMADAYTWTDEEGVVHYSDRPVPGATRIVLAEPNTGRSPAPRPRASPAATDGPESAAEAAPFRYESFDVTAPGAEETLWNIEGVLNVSLSLKPGLQAGHQVRVYFDGNPQMVSGLSFQLNEVYRGVHNLQAEVLDETGQMLIRTRPNRFYVQQATVR
ncbi:MAG: DUF4124 domain-containing protein [Woeseiaceae bacterium]|jgi:hypothetical protein